jgi:tetratricopeptide (TPR) repeat protein
VADHPRIEELRRRIQKDPASIAFAQLAEEHRRAAQYEEAIAVCRAGLAQHPAYLSARITLGRSLTEVGRLDEAAEEFDYVLKAAPDNLTATRELAEINQRRRALAPPVAPSLSSPTAPQPDFMADPVVTELEAWLAVLAQDRVTGSPGV